MKFIGQIVLLVSCIATSFAQVNLPDPEGLRRSGMHPSDCNRATPESVVYDSVFSSTKFLLAADSLNGYNWVNFKNGDKLLIINCGCTDYTLVFQFTTNRYNTDTGNMKYWYLKAAELLTEVAKGIVTDIPFKINKGADTLVSFVAHYPDSLKLNRAIYFYKGPPPDDSDTPDEAQEYSTMFPHFFISRIQKLPGNEYMVEVTFTVSL